MTKINNMIDWILTKTPLFYLVQSLWRDEAFSVLTAEKPVLSFIGNLNLEPPLYYVLLHFWIKIFGESEIAVRSLSLLGFCLAVVVIIFWAEKLFEKHWLAWVVPLFFFFNPMLLYYAFEVRAYGWLMFFSALSMYAYSQKKIRLLTVVNILAFYTHSYGIFLPLVEGIHHLFFTYGLKRVNLKILIKDKKIHSFLITVCAFVPWLILAASEARKLSKASWYFPVDFQLVKSVLGNLFTSYEGTPGGLWGYTAIVSLVLLGLFFLALRNQKHQKNVIFLLSMVFIPIIITIGVSFIKSIYTNKYLIFVTMSEIILLGYAILSIKNKLLQKVLAVSLLLFMITMNLFFPSSKKKFDSRKLIAEANSIRGPHDVLYVATSLLYFETVYYTPDRKNVFYYSPDHSPFPWYVGDTAFSPSQRRDTFPLFPDRAVVISPNRPLSIHSQIIQYIPYVTNH